ncbi:MAG TPA: hypothetical protein VGJ06_21365 [Candidatus Acidoferrum sp.]|jgi:hypothetical protein
MTLKMVIAPLTLAVLTLLLVCTQPGVSCVVTLVAKIVTHISL